jgi:CRISPR-associated protein Cmr3
MQGVIRSHHLAVKGVDLRDPQAIAGLVGGSNEYGELRLRGPFLACQTNGQMKRYFPLPADIAPTDDNRWRALKQGRLPPGVVTSAPVELPQLLWPSFPAAKGETDGWLAQDDLLRCLAGQDVQPLAPKCLFERENRLGIGRDDARSTTKDEALYEVEFIRPQPHTGLWVEIAGYDGWPSHGSMRIGGEGRGAYFQQVTTLLKWPDPPDPLPRRFKVYFASPAYFENGWQPKDGWGRFFQGQVSLLAAAIRRYETLGGYDWAKNEHKPARRYLPAGSVYYFESDGKARLQPNLIQNAITDAGAEIGFGQILITPKE